MEFDINTIQNHVANTFFSLQLISHSDEKTLLTFSARDSFVDCLASGSFLGCLVDYAVRLAARLSVGDYLVSEYEINFEPVCRVREFIACTQLNASDQQHVTYACEIFMMENGERKLFAEAQGTLVPR